MTAYMRLLFVNLRAMFHPRALQREGKPKWRGYLLYALCVISGAILYGMLVWVEMITFDFAKRFGDPAFLLALLFFGATATCLVFGLFQMISSLFFSKDTAFLSTLPMTSRSVLLSKMGMVMVSEGLFVLALSFPLILRYGIFTSQNAVYYLGMILGSLLVPAVPIAVATCIAFALIRISGLWKRRETITTVAVFLVIIGNVCLQFLIQKNVAEEQMNDLLLQIVFGQSSMVSMITAYYPPLAWLMAFAVQGSGMGWMQGVAFLMTSLALIGLIAFILGKSYIPLALKQSETMQSMNAQGKKSKQTEKQRSPFWALYRLEMRTILQSPAYATNGLTGLVMCPLILGVVVMSITSQKGGTDLLKMITTELPSEIYLLAIVVIFLMGCLLSITVGTAVTREGRTLMHRRTFPVSPVVSLGAKLSTGLMINLWAVLPCGIALMVLLPQWWMVTLIAMITSQLFSVAICLINLAMDVYFPRLLWKSETEAIKKSLNALFSMLISTVVIGLAGVIVWFVGIERQAGIWMGYGVMNAFMILMVTVFSLWFYKHVPKVYATKGYQT